LGGTLAPLCLILSPRPTSSFHPCPSSSIQPKPHRLERRRRRRRPGRRSGHRHAQGSSHCRGSVTRSLEDATSPAPSSKSPSCLVALELRRTDYDDAHQKSSSRIRVPAPRTLRPGTAAVSTCCQRQHFRYYRYVFVAGTCAIGGSRCRSSSFSCCP
jgi:hypothetical protein